MSRPAELAPLPRKPLKEEIFEVLHRQIIAGHYPPGSWLRQEEIAAQLGVSMTPVREALDLLTSAGLAERVPYRGVRVPVLSPQEIAEAYAMRLLLEAIAARAAATHIKRDQLEGLKRTLEEMRGQVTLNDMSLARQLSREFHQGIVEASGNTLLLRLYRLAANSFPDWMLYEAMFRHPELLEESLAQEHAEHVAIVAALEQGDEKQAMEMVIRHILHLGQEIETLLAIPAALLRASEQLILTSLQET